MSVTIKHGGAYTKDGEIIIESRDVIAVTGDTDALFLAMESPFEEVISHAAKHGSLAELWIWCKRKLRRWPRRQHENFRV